MEESAANNSLINELPDDCLKHIFSFLPISERLEAEKVCKRWYVISDEGWNDVNKLTISRNYSDNTVHSILKRCGRFLKKLRIFDSLEHPHWLSMIIKFCKLNQLEDIEINFWSGKRNDECSIRNLRKIFRKARKLAAVIIEGFNILNAVNCLNVLNPETLQKLVLDDRNQCSVNGERPSINLDKFPNLKEIDFHGMKIFGNKMKRKEESLKGLEKLHLHNCDVPENFIQRIATFTHLQELILQRNDCDLKNEHICDIAENCGKLRHMWVEGSPDLTSDCFQYLGKMLSLERLTLQEFQDVDYGNFIYLMNVKRLDFYFDEYTDSGDVLIELIADSSNLEKLVLGFAYNVDLAFVDDIREIFHCGLREKLLEIIIRSDEESFPHDVRVESDHPLLTVSYDSY